MKLQLLGTGAAEGIPAYFPDCRVCRYARENGGKDVRSRPAALLDNLIKIDFGPDTWHQMQANDLDARYWSALLFTHSDDDHFSPREMQYFFYPFVDDERLAFTIYANADICNVLRTEYPEWPLDVVETHSFLPFQIGAYKVTPIKANHKLTEDSHNYIFEHNGKALLYATDTGIWHEETWEALQKFKLDGLVIECTEGVRPTDYDGHLDINECKKVVGRLRQMQVLGPGSRVVTTHHSHNGDATHEELEMLLKPFGIETGYDGYVLEI